MDTYTRIHMIRLMEKLNKEENKEFSKNLKIIDGFEYISKMNNKERKRI